MNTSKRVLAMVLAILTFALFALGSGGSSSGKANPNDAGYYKKNGKWYFQGKGAY